MLLLLHRSWYDYMKMGGQNKTHQLRGFTLIELTIIISVIGILATITTAVIVPISREKAKHAQAMSDMNTIVNAAQMYAAKYNDFPVDSPGSIPSGLNEFIKNDNHKADWPSGPWKGSTYSFNNWPADDNGNKQTYQVTLSFCNPGDTATCKKTFPKEPWVKDTWDSYSTAYMCVSGSCRSSQDKPVNYPGFCMNCTGAMKDMGH
ncbi:type II secretion system protein [bacterium]|nr:type II secretion system protein [bacterium]